MSDLWVSGCYTPSRDGRGSGLELWRGSGADLVPVGGLPADSPSYVIWHPRLPVVYAVRETDDGAVSAYRLDGTSLTLTGELPTDGAAPCQLLLLDDLDLLLACNYSGGSVTVFSVDHDTGALLSQQRLWRPAGEQNATRSHPHTAIVRPGTDELWLVDLGMDTIYRARLRSAASWDDLEPIGFPPGTGPRQVRFAADGTVYVVGELSGRLFALHGDDVRSVASTRSEEVNYAAHLLLSPDERYAYISNRGPDTIAVLDLSGPDPRLVGEVVLRGSWPRHCAYSDGVLAVSLERSDLIEFLAVDGSTLTPLGTLATPSPTCLARRPG